jgi:hypothetical protein
MTRPRSRSLACITWRTYAIDVAEHRAHGSRAMLGQQVLLQLVEEPLAALGVVVADASLLDGDVGEMDHGVHRLLPAGHKNKT